MDDTSWRSVRAAYEDAIDLPTEDLRPKTRRLSPAEHETLGFMLEVASHRDEELTARAGLGVGDLVGPFLIRSHLGEGGMGSVFLAEQMTPIRRTVALKVVRADLASPRFARRFESERQALALMEHPGIAKVLEADAGPDGSPYFAMEYVDGVAIDGYCDAEQLSVRQRVELMIQVCEAIEHAHRRGVIHRDLKPSNVLIGQVSGAPQAKVIDFGIAKALAPEPGVGADETEFGRILGTPVYMSPEQIEGEPLDVRSDVWALSMMLYQLVTGSLPYPDDLHEETNPVRRLIRMRETGIPRPSVRYSRQTQERRESAAHERGTSVAVLSKRLRNDLDWILLKGLEEDRELRYGSVSDLKEDLQNFLARRAVAARPTDRLYLLRKFVARHRLMVSAVTVALVALIAGTIAASLGLVRARRAEAVASAEADRAAAINDFLVEMLSSADPHEGSRDIEVSEILEAAAAELAERFPDRPDVRVELLKTMGATFHSLGRSDRGIELLERAVDEARVLGDEPRSLEAAAELGEAYGEVGRIDEAIAVTEPILERSVGGGHEAQLIRATALNNLAVFFYHSGRGEEGPALIEKAVGIRTELLGLSHEKTLGALSNLAGFRSALGDKEGALVDLRELLSRKGDVLGESHPSTLATAELLGNTYGHLDREVEGEPVLRRNYEAVLEVFGPGHRRVGIAATALGRNMLNQGRFFEALPLVSEAREIVVTVIGEGTDFGIGALELEALTLAGLERFAEAETRAAEALAALEATFPDDIDWKAGLTETLAFSRLQPSQLTEAVAGFEEVLLLRLDVAADARARGRAWLDLAEELIAAEVASPRVVEAAENASRAFDEADEAELTKRSQVAKASGLSLLGSHDDSLALLSTVLGDPQAPDSENVDLLIAYGDALDRAGRDGAPCFEAALDRWPERTVQREQAWRVHRRLIGRSLTAAGTTADHRQLAAVGCFESLGPDHPACAAL